MILPNNYDTFKLTKCKPTKFHRSIYSLSFLVYGKRAKLKTFNKLLIHKPPFSLVNTLCFDGPKFFASLFTPTSQKRFKKYTILRILPKETSKKRRNYTNKEVKTNFKRIRRSSIERFPHFQDNNFSFRSTTKFQKDISFGIITY